MSSQVFEHQYGVLRKGIDRRLASLANVHDPFELTAASKYVLVGGGKRVRGVLTLLSCKAVGGSTRAALDAGAAVELMHNFTLVHDDIMDSASSRRGRPTVHTKWNVNTALLVGDVLLGLAYRQAIRNATKNCIRILDLFTNALLEVCEGQALDLEFERRTDITLHDYFRMIEKKTARLISLSTEVGAIIGGGSERDITALKQFGHYLGRSFQLQDDLLDILAKEKEFGKPVGGDIMEGKRTFLLLHAMERARGNDKALLERVLRKQTRTPDRRRHLVDRVSAIYQRYGVIADAQRRIAADTGRAKKALGHLSTNGSVEMLSWLSDMLLTRRS